MEPVDQREHKKGIIGVLMFLSLVVIVIAIFYIYDAVSGTSTGRRSPTPAPTALPIPGGTLEIKFDNPNSGKEVQGTMDTVTELKIEDVVVGGGVEAVSGKRVTVNYIGTLTNGQKFDSSYDRNTPFTFTLGAGEVIKGWDQGVVGMKAGGKRKLTIPSTLAYGDQGVPNVIPGGATLVFEVELLSVE